MRKPAAPPACSLLLIDDIVPADFSPFRTLEYQHYLEFFENSYLLCTEGWHGWAANGNTYQVMERSGWPSELRDKVGTWDMLECMHARLAYISFLNNAWQALPLLSLRQLPFILQLYPGGGFEPGNIEADMRLQQVVGSPLCRKVVVTQQFAYSHLISTLGCAPEKVELIYGGVYNTRHEFDFARDKLFFGQHKQTIDICFVAHRYGDDVIKKGYAPFIALAHALSPKHPELRFHVVGDYTPDMVPLGSLGDLIRFHGKQPNSFFADFYPSMDMIVSINRPSHDDSGAFDGFPTGACMEAGFRGVLNAITDPLKLNIAFSDDVDIVLLDFDTDRTALRLEALISQPEAMYRLAEANHRKFLKVFDTDRQLWQRCRLIASELLDTSVALIHRPTARQSMLDARFKPQRTADVNLMEENLLLRHRVATFRSEAELGRESAENANRRHDALMVEYQKLDEALKEFRAYHAQSTAAAEAELAVLRDAHHELRLRLDLSLAETLSETDMRALRLARKPWARRIDAALMNLFRTRGDGAAR